jgi:hypothetical protein
MQNEDVSLASVKARDLPIRHALRHSLGNVPRSEEQQERRNVVGSPAKYFTALARFILLVSIYVFLIVAIIASLDSTQSANETPSINFAYKVF